MNTLFMALLGILVLLVLILAWMVISLNKRIGQFTRGNNGINLETLIKKLIADQEIAVKNHNGLVAMVQEIDARMETSPRGFAMTRYNAYEHTGGNQSFSVVFLDETGKGMVLSNLYSRDRSNIFAKPIANFKTDLELTREEKSVLKQAIENMKL